MKWHAKITREVKQNARGMRSAGLAALLLLVLTAAAAVGCGEADETESQGPSTPTVAATPSPSATETSPLFATSRWECGTASLAETRRVAREYLAAVLERDVSPHVADMYADEFTLDNFIAETRIDDAMTAKSTWGIWESNLYWSRDAKVCVTPGVAVISCAVMDDPEDPTTVLPYVTLLAVSDGRITHDETLGDPHETGVMTAGWKAASAPAGKSDTSKEARAVAEKVREALQTGWFGLLRRVYDPDIVLLDTSARRPLHGFDAVLDWHRGTTRIVGLESVAIEPPIAGPGWAVLRTTTRGTIDMNAVSMPGAMVMDVRDGKVVRMTVYYDSTVLDLSP